MRDNLFASYPKKFSQVSQIDHNPLMNNLVVTVSQVSPIDRLLQQIFQDLDIRTRSSPGFMKLKTTRPKASSRSNSS